MIIGGPRITPMLDNLVRKFLIHIPGTNQSKRLAAVRDPKQQLPKYKPLPKHGAVFTGNPAMDLLNASDLERPVNADPFKIRVTRAADKMKILNPRPAKKA